MSIADLHGIGALMDLAAKQKQPKVGKQAAKQPDVGSRGTDAEVTPGQKPLTEEEKYVLTLMALLAKKNADNPYDVKNPFKKSDGTVNESLAGTAYQNAKSISAQMEKGVVTRAELMALDVASTKAKDSYAAKYGGKRYTSPQMDVIAKNIKSSGHEMWGGLPSTGSEIQNKADYYDNMLRYRQFITDFSNQVQAETVGAIKKASPILIKNLMDAIGTYAKVVGKSARDAGTLRDPRKFSKMQKYAKAAVNIIGAASSQMTGNVSTELTVTPVPPPAEVVPVPPPPPPTTTTTYYIGTIDLDANEKPRLSLTPSDISRYNVQVTTTGGVITGVVAVAQFPAHLENGQVTLNATLKVDEVGGIVPEDPPTLAVRDSATGLIWFDRYGSKVRTSGMGSRKIRGLSGDRQPLREESGIGVLLLFGGLIYLLYKGK